MFTNIKSNKLKIWPYPWSWMQYRHRRSSPPRWVRLDRITAETPLSLNFHTLSTFYFMVQPQGGLPLPPYIGNLILDIPAEKAKTSQEAAASINMILRRLEVPKEYLRLTFMNQGGIRLQISFSYFVPYGFIRNDTIKLYATLIERIKTQTGLEFIKNVYDSNNIYDYYYYCDPLSFDQQIQPTIPYPLHFFYPISTYPTWVNDQYFPRDFMQAIEAQRPSRLLADWFEEILKTHPNMMTLPPPSVCREAQDIWGHLTRCCGVLHQWPRNKEDMKPLLLTVASRFSPDVAEAILISIDASEFKWGTMKKTPIDCTWLKATFGDCGQNCGVNSPVELIHTLPKFQLKPPSNMIYTPYGFSTLHNFSRACSGICEEFQTNCLVAACTLTLIMLSLLAGKLQFRNKKGSLVPVSLNLLCVRDGDKLPAWNFAEVIVAADTSYDVVPPEKRYFTTASTPVALFKELAKNSRLSLIPDLEGKLFKQITDTRTSTSDFMRLLLSTQKGKSFTYNRTKIPNRCLNLFSFITYKQATMLQARPIYSAKHFMLNTLIISPAPNATPQVEPCSLQAFRDHIAKLSEVAEMQAVHEIPEPIDGEAPNFRQVMAYAIMFYEYGELKEPTPEALSVANGFMARYEQQMQYLKKDLEQTPHQKIAQRISAQIRKQKLLYFRARNMQNALGNVTKKQIDFGLKLLVEQGELAPVRPLCSLPGRSAYGELYMVNKDGPRKANPLTGDIGEFLLKNTLKINKDNN